MDTYLAFLVICEGHPLVMIRYEWNPSSISGFPHKRSVIQYFDVASPKKLLEKNNRVPLFYLLAKTDISSLK